MAFRFVLGRSGTDKSAWIRKEIRNKIQKHPRGPAIFYIVPDQMTFQQEYMLFHDQEINGSIRAQVVSFSRLAWRVFQETGGGTKQFISSIGIQMMLRKIIEERQEDWKVFQKAVEKTGFLAQLEQLLAEFKRYDITPEILKQQREQIARFVHQTSSEVSLMNKLDDLIYVYEKLIISLQDQYIDTEDQLDLLAEKIAEAPGLQDAEVYFAGFHRFTPKELRVIEQLMKRSKRITFALTVDENAEGELSELDLFYQPKKTYQMLRDLATYHSYPIEEIIRLKIPKNIVQNYPHFIHLEQNFDMHPAPAYSKNEQAPIKMAEAVHPRAEVEGVAQEIISLIRDQQYRFDDIVIFIREPDTYHDLIRTIFRDYNIPVFIDEKRTMLNHPLVEFIRSALEVVESNWRYDALFRVLKTGFITSSDPSYPLTSRAIDELENYVLEYGIRSRHQWLGDEEWVFQRFRGFDQGAQTDVEMNTQKRINKYRKQVAEMLSQFDHEIRQAKTIHKYCEAIYILLEKVQVPEHLQSLQQTFTEQGDNEQAREQEQVWEGIIQLFDEIVEMAGDEEMSLASFRATLDAGLETLEFAHVPPSIDHVIVGSIDRSRISGKKCAFLLGVNDGVWPMKPPTDGVINEEERTLLAEHGIELAESNRRKLLDDWFYMYLAFTSVYQWLWISYPLSDEEGDTQEPSPLIDRIISLFPSCKHPILLKDPDELIEADRFITTPEKTRSALTAQLARYERGYPIKPIWFDVLNWYIEHKHANGMTHKIIQSIYYENQPVSLSQETVQKFYPKDEPLQTSVSRLEMFYRCSYQHFIQYNLKLQERKIYKLDAPDIGQLFHEAIKTITEWVREEEKEFAQLTERDAAFYAKKAMKKLSPILQHQILHSSNRYQYIQQKLQEVIARATFVLSEQARVSHFSPVGIEIGFGSRNDQLQPKRMKLPNGYELILRGRIDRVDQAQVDDELYLRIIDYKSSSRGLSLIDVYYGLALQMLTYLDVVLMQSEQWLGLRAMPAGILYFHVHNAMLSRNDILSETKRKQELFKQYKMQGMLISDENIVRLMDTSLKQGTSQIVPAGIKKNGGFYKHSKVANSQTFSLLRAHINLLIEQAGVTITSGDIQLNPYVYKQQSACKFCPFHSVCQFDPTLGDHDFRRLPQMKDEEVLEKLQKEEGLS